MDKIEELLQKNIFKNKKLIPTAQCPNEGLLAGYLGKALNREEKENVERHIGECLYCLEQLNLAYEAQKAFISGSLGLSEQKLIEKAKKVALLAPSKSKRKGKVWFTATIVSFALSFIFPRYFLQFLAAAVILGIKWIFESDAAKSLIMVLDKRQHHKDKEEDLPEKVKERS